jgi:hypothetical protein
LSDEGTREYLNEKKKSKRKKFDEENATKKPR